MNSQQMIEEIDRLARLCEAKDAENKKLRGILSLKETLIENTELILSESHAQIAIKDVELDERARLLLDTTQAGCRLTDELSEARTQIAMLHDLCIWMSGCGYDFCQHEYWIAHRAVIGDTQATALAYEREVENRGAVKALEEAASKFDSGDWFARDTLKKMAAEARIKASTIDKVEYKVRYGINTELEDFKKELREKGTIVEAHIEQQLSEAQAQIAMQAEDIKSALALMAAELRANKGE